MNTHLGRCLSTHSALVFMLSSINLVRACTLLHKYHINKTCPDGNAVFCNEAKSGNALPNVEISLQEFLFIFQVSGLCFNAKEANWKSPVTCFYSFTVISGSSDRCYLSEFHW